MKVLLDENLPHKLRTLLPGHECFTADFMGWSGMANGELLRVAASIGFDVLISTDKGLEYEQNHAALPLAVLVLVAKDNKLGTLEALMPRVAESLANLKAKSFSKIESKN